MEELNSKQEDHVLEQAKEETPIKYLNNSLISSFVISPE